MVGRAAELFQPAFHIGVEPLRLGQRIAAGEDDLGGLGCKLPAGLRGAGLDDDRPALNRARDIERTAHLEILALVIEHIHALGVEINFRLDVANERVLGETVPEPGHDVIELARAAIALVVLRVVVQTEIERRVRVRGGEDVQPARPPLR